MYSVLKSRGDAGSARRLSTDNVKTCFSRAGPKSLTNDLPCYVTEIKLSNNTTLLCVSLSWGTECE